ncbi:hypothetical protein F5884DRAFT_384321 [Xylogone sp. PMI_703]|nr:hypothetical protein F5884DRAFT_384321 [Xylogone sp. PMI_703]
MGHACAAKPTRAKAWYSRYCTVVIACVGLSGDAQVQRNPGIGFPGSEFYSIFVDDCLALFEAAVKDLCPRTKMVRLQSVGGGARGLGCVLPLSLAGLIPPQRAVRLSGHPNTTQHDGAGVAACPRPPTSTCRQTLEGTSFKGRMNLECFQSMMEMKI